MAATTTFGVLPSAVLAGLPFAEGTVHSASPGLNTGLITRYIQEGSSRICAALVSIGADPSALGDDAQGIAETGVLAYARAQCLIKREYPAAEIDRHLDAWNEHLTLITSFVGGLGESDPTHRQIVSTSSSSPSRRFKERWNGF